VDGSGRFLFGSNDNPPLSLALRQALYLWASRAANQHRFSYEIWRAVEHQLESYPHNRQWTLPLGDGWYVERLGSSLRMASITVADRHGNATGYKVPLGERLVPWSFTNNEMTTNAIEGNLVVRCDEKVFGDGSGFGFVISSAETANRWMFTPPWRKGRSPLKLGSFLRGRKVPQHLRASVPIIYCQFRTIGMGEIAEPVLVAVCVDNKWIVDAAWDPYHGEEGSRELSISTIILNLADGHEQQGE
jgi:hypothetical protein